MAALARDVELRAEQVGAGGQRRPGDQAERFLGRRQRARRGEATRHPPQRQAGGDLSGAEALPGGERLLDHDHRPQRAVAADRAGAVAVGDRRRECRGEQRREQEEQCAATPSHAARSSRSECSGSSSIASEPRSERRRAKRPPCAAATRLTTASPWPWR